MLAGIRLSVLDAEELVGRDAERAAEGDDRQRGRVAGVILVVGDGALGGVGGLGELDLGQSSGLRSAARRSPKSDGGSFLRGISKNSVRVISGSPRFRGVVRLP